MSKSPSYYKKKWYNHYEKIAKAKGITFGPRQFKRIESGFCYKEWAKDNKKSGINALLQWHYEDVITDIICSPNKLLSFIIKEPDPVVTSLFKGKWFQRKSHADLWKKS